jgi:hypothetical protein
MKRVGSTHELWICATLYSPADGHLRLLTDTMISRYAFLLLWTVLAVAAHAGSAPFDLAGPTLDVKITRGSVTLPAAEVPNLAVGDRVWLKADLPASQSAHYLLIAAFLRGATNPPPADWFFECKTWTKKCAAEGLTVTVPQDAQQVLIFLAPETGGDFKTLVSAVRGRPGAFVRTSQDLNQAALDRSRLERYLTTIRSLNDADPAKISQVAPLLARSLAIKVDDKCLDRLPELQAPCLMMGQESLILNDGHSTSIVEALTSGPGSDLAMEASYTPQLSYGYYSPYIASVLDIARIFDSFSTAQYQYIPALASPRGDHIALTLNAAPSFHDPKSVLVAALPAVEQAQLPPLHAVDPKEIYCARRTSLVLPVEGAPLVFSTGFAHDVTLSLTGTDGKTLELPATADPTQGGYVVDTAALGHATLGDSVQASLHGFWGFDAYQGPRFKLMNAHASSWALEGDDSALIVGRQDTVHLRADNVSCVDGIMLRDPGGKELKAEWKAVKPDEVEVKLPLQDAAAGAMTLLVKQYGVADPQPVNLRLFAEAGRFDGFAIHAGETEGLLKGSRLDEVASISFKNVTFVPEPSLRTNNDELPMVAEQPAAALALKPEHGINAKVTLQDGRTLPLTVAVDAPRPRATLIGKYVAVSPDAKDANIQLADGGELPLDATLIFSLRSITPATFAHDVTVDIATGDESSLTTLTLATGGLTLENTRVAVATFNPAKAFGGSAFGPLKYRVSAKGVSGDWQPLASLVRLPLLKELTCPATPDLACKLVGSNLFLIDSVASNPEFRHPVTVPDGFLGLALPVPHPDGGPLYVRLRDNPQVANPMTLPVQQLPVPADDAGRTADRHSANNDAAAPPDLAPPQPVPTAAAAAAAPAPVPAPAPAPATLPAPAAAAPPSAAAAPLPAPPAATPPSATSAPAAAAARPTATPAAPPLPAATPSPSTATPPVATPSAAAATTPVPAVAATPTSGAATP